MLKLASSIFDAFITINPNLTSQQNLQQIDLIIIVLIAKYNRITTFQPLMIEVNQALESLNQDDVIYIK